MILLLGASGYIGSAFVRHFKAQERAFLPISRSECDYTKRSCLIRLIEETKPSFLINAAGYSGKPNVDACEDHKADCLMGNAVLPAIIRETCEACRLPWGHVSSGCIYNGRREDGRGFRESDPPNFSFRSPPCSFYAGSKALGEECLHGSDNVFVWRLRIPFNHLDSPRNYLSKLMRYDRLLDVKNSITQLDEFVEACLQCWDRRVPPGIYNVTNTGSVETSEVVTMMLGAWDLDRQFRFFRDETEFMQYAARTPRSSCVLDNGKLLNTGIFMSDVRDAIMKSLLQWSPATPNNDGTKRTGMISTQ